MYDVIGRGRVIVRQLSQGPVLTSYARRALKINKNGLATRRLVGTTPKRLMTPAKHRCFLPLMAIHWITSLMTFHYDSINSNSNKQITDLKWFSIRQRKMKHHITVLLTKCND